VIEVLWAFFNELWSFISTTFDAKRDIADIVIVTLGIYWLLLLIRGTRAVQIVVGLLVLIALSFASNYFQLATLGLILENFMSSAVLIIIVLFQNDIRRALARVGRGFFPSVSDKQETQIVEEVVRACQTLAQKRVGALIVLERDTALADRIDAGGQIDAVVSKDLLISLFLPHSPLHDGAVVISDGRITSVGCILPLTLSQELPEGVGTRHRAAVGITEETDALVVVSEETATISVVMGGRMVRALDAPRLRVVLRDILTGKQHELIEDVEPSPRLELADAGDGGESEPPSIGTRTAG